MCVYLYMQTQPQTHTYIHIHICLHIHTIHTFSHRFIRPDILMLTNVDKCLLVLACKNAGYGYHLMQLWCENARSIKPGLGVETAYYYTMVNGTNSKKPWQIRKMVARPASRGA